MKWIQDNWFSVMLVAGWVGWFVDNVLAQVPALKSNSSFQVLCNVIDTIVGKIKGTKDPLQPQ